LGRIGVNMNREVDLIKMDFCKFKCPFKDKNKIKTILDIFEESLGDDELNIYNYQKEVILNEVEEELKYIGCNLCPLNDFINRLGVTKNKN
jgi:hypothetical protein